jgi:hypothetical protein
MGISPESWHKNNEGTGKMIETLFPPIAARPYIGPKAVKWVFLLFTVVTLGRSLAHLFLPDGGAQSIATIPLDSFSSSASAVIVGMFAQWGLTQLLFGLIYVIVLWRYQALIPLMWLFIFIEYSGRFLLSLYKPFETVGQAPGGIGNRIIPLLAVIMLLLSFRTPKTTVKE